AIGDGTPIEAGSEFAIFRIDIHDIADIAVVDFFVVVVLDLHDLVAGREGPAESFDLAFAGRIQVPLQFDVACGRASPASVHRGQHLDIADGIEAEAARDAGSY